MKVINRIINILVVLIFREVLAENNLKNSGKSSIDNKMTISLLNSLNNHGLSNIANLTGLTNFMDEYSTLNNRTLNTSAVNGQIVFSAWVKYYKSSELDPRNQAPKGFYKNKYFFEQKKIFPQANLDELSSDGTRIINTYIKSPTHFYLVLFNNSLNLLSSRQIQLEKTFDIINLKEGSEQKMEIQDLGDFEEGFCMKISIEKPKSDAWIICTDSRVEKVKLMDALGKFNIQNEADNGQFLLANFTESFLMTSPESNVVTKDGSGNLGVKLKSINDGYWIVLQNWTQCSLKCGGGTTTLQRMCVPPKQGGAPCEGSKVVNKPCNTHPCPRVMITSPTKGPLLSSYTPQRRG